MKKITKFKDIPQLTRAGSCNTNIPLTHMLKTISEWEQDEYYQLQLNPNFQRGHVWTEKQQMLFVEFLLRGGKSARVIYFNKPSWQMTKTVNGYDEDKDLAVVSVALSDISDDTMDQIAVATVGSSDDLKVGEQVIAIGNALGYGQSVTTGIVSAKNRKLNDEGLEEDEDSDATNLIQTDAAINPGNSGGALLNMDGEVVGINSAKLASTEVEGMGYAIAISDVTDTLEDLMNETPRDKVDNHGVLGITGARMRLDAPAGSGACEAVRGRSGRLLHRKHQGRA